MSELAGVYYQKRADDLDIADVPAILNGQPIQLVPDGEESQEALLVSNFCEQVQPAEAYALAGIPGTYEAGGKGLPMSDWQKIRALPRYNRIDSVEQYASRRIARAMYLGLSVRSAVYLEAVTRREMPQSAIFRATTNNYKRATTQEQESAQVFLLTRAVARGQCVSTHLTVLWGDHQVGTKIGRQERCANHLTPRYLGTIILPSELQDLPPLPLAAG